MRPVRRGCGDSRRKTRTTSPCWAWGGALIFFLSLIPVPAFTGTCSHPCGTPLVGMLLGPLIGTALTGMSLLLQAAFFAHGGFGTWGANVVTLGFFGCFFGWAVFRIARACGAPVWAAGCAGGIIGDVAVYAASGLVLGVTLTHAPTPQYSLGGYLAVIYTAYLPTQLPIAVGEMVITGLALNYAYRQRPEVLHHLGVIKRPGGAKTHPVVLASILAGAMTLTVIGLPVNARAGEVPDAGGAAREMKTFAGMDETVNAHLARQAGRYPKSPFIDTEAMGDLWNLLLLGAGGICGFVLGRYWHILWGNSGAGKPRDTSASKGLSRPMEGV